MESHSSEQDGSQKKGPFDNLTRDDLIKKCKGLLGIAQKAKQAKDELLDENKQLKEELQNFETQKHADKECLKAMQELVDSLTQNKLAFTTQVSDLQAKINNQEKLLKHLSKENEKSSNLSIENESLKRQINRLTEENDQLLKDFDKLEKKFEDASKISLEQQKGLLLLEKSTEHLERENTKLKEEKNQLILKSEHIIGHDNDIKLLKEEHESLKLKKLKSDEKLKLFKTKILEFSQKLKHLKLSRETLIEIVQDYSKTIPKWQNEISYLSTKVFDKLLHYEAENRKLLNIITDLELKMDENDVRIINEDSKEIPTELKNVKQELKIVFNEINEKIKNSTIDNHKIREIVGDNEALRIQLDEIIKEKDVLQMSVKEMHTLFKKLIKQINIINQYTSDDRSKDEIKKHCEQYLNDISEKTEIIEEFQVNFQKLQIENNIKYEEIKKLETMKSEMDQEIIKLQKTINDNSAESTNDDMLQKKIEEQSVQIIHQLKTIELLNSDLEGAKNSCDAILAINDQNQEINQALTTEKNLYKNTCEKYENEITSLNDELNSLKVEYDNVKDLLEAKNSDLIVAKEEWSNTIKELENEIEKLHKAGGNRSYDEIIDHNASEDTSGLKAILDQIEVLKNDNKNLEVIEIQLVESIDNLNKNCEKYEQETIQKNKKYLENISEKSKIIEELKINVESITVENNNKYVEIQKLTEKLEVLQKSIENQSSDSSCNDSLQQKIEEQSIQLMHQLKTIENLNSDLEEAKNSCEVILAVNDQNQEINQAVTIEKNHFKNNCEKYEKEIQNFNESINNLNEELSSLKIKYDDVQKLLVEKNDELNSVREGFKEDSNVKVKELEKEIEMLIVTANNREKDIQQKLNDKDNELKIHLDEIVVLKTETHELSQKIKALEDNEMQIVENIDNLKKICEKYEQEILKKNEYIQEIVEESNRIKNEYEQLQHKNENLQITLTDSKIDHSNRIENLEKMLNEKNDELNQLKENLTEEFNRNITLNDEIKKLTQNLELIKVDDSTKHAETKNTDEHFDTLNEKHEEFKLIQEQLKHKITEIETFENKIEDLNKNNEKLQVNEIQLKQTIEQLIQDRNDKQNIIKNLNENIEIIRKQKEHIENQLEFELKKNTEISNEFSISINQLKERLNEKSNELEKCLAEHNEFLKHKDNELQSTISKLNISLSENQELLGEMKEINQILKERGGVISKQQLIISELEATVRELEKREINLQITVKQNDEIISHKDTELELANKLCKELQNELIKLKNVCDDKERNIKELSDEVQCQRDRSCSNMDTQSEILSTSTISKADESMRMREIEDSFEEKYNKLRTLAVKLKKKVTEQTAHIANLETHQKSTSEETTKLVKSDQAQIDYKNEIDAFKLIISDREDEIIKLKKSLDNKEKDLNQKLEHEKQMKIELEKSRKAVKKTNVLSLEMDAYEKSTNDLKQKLDLKNIQYTELETVINNLNGTIQSMKEQLKLVEDSLEAEKNHSKELKTQIDIQQNKFKESEHEKFDLSLKYDALGRDFENLKLEMDESKVQFTECMADKDKLCTTALSEKEKLLRQVYSLEDELENVKANLRAAEKEIDNIKTEFASYKIRAQSVLRQNQSRDSSREKELEEEIVTLQSTIDSLNNQIKSSVQESENLKKQLNETKEDKESSTKRCKELMDLLEESRKYNETILDDAKIQSEKQQEIIKTQRIQIETLNNCYKIQIEELELKYKDEIEILKQLPHKTKEIGSIAQSSRDDKKNFPYNTTSNENVEHKIQMLLLEREEGEGSENTNSSAAGHSSMIPHRRISNPRNRHEVIPLEDLLNNPFEESIIEERAISPTAELKTVKDKLNVQESRVKHLTTLLAEAEQDLAKLTQLNGVLKEEVRRQQRSLEREQHIQNSEYIKNVILKFLTLNSGDEKSHLVPVLNTILRLSPEETQKLQSVAKGEGSKWLGKLPLWNNNN